MNTNELDAQDLLQASPKTKEDYLEILSLFDAATCEACAVGQAIPGRMVDSHIGWATYIFAQMSSRAVAMMRAAPHSRWVRSDFEDWHFSPIAGYTRSIIEALQLFCYFISSVDSEAESKARVDLLYLYDCSKRLKHFTTMESKEEIASFTDSQKIIRARLLANEYFLSLPEKVKTKCLSGTAQMFISPDEAAEAAGYDKNVSRLYWDFLSQNIHILSMGFSRMEPNGRGTGLENEIDRSYISAALLVCAGALNKATTLMLDAFPDAAGVRNGVKSRFSPGPKENSRHRSFPPQREQRPAVEVRRDILASSIQEALGVSNDVAPLGFWLDRRANRFTMPAYNIGVWTNGASEMVAPVEVPVSCK